MRRFGADRVGRHALVALGSLLWGCTVHAAIVPEKGVKDARVRTVVYDPGQVYLLQGFAGYAIHLQFGAEERFEGLGAGDIEGVSFVAQGNHLFLKPKAARVSTNLTLLTNRHTYHIAYAVTGRRPDPAVDEIIYSLEFQYPDEVAAAVASAAVTHRVEAALKTPSVRAINRAYGFCGPGSLKPQGATDDGVETRLVFPPSVELPAVFVRHEDGSESLVNFTVDHEALILHQVARAFVLRRGTLVGCIVNQAYQGSGAALPTGTLSPTVRRESVGDRP